MLKRARTRWFTAMVAGFACTGAVAAVTVAWGEDRATTASTIDALDHDTVHKDAIAANVKRAKEAVERATRLRAAGDEAHARLADGLAFEEATGAEDLARAIDAEKAANDARRAATDAGVVGDRERALLEEGIARNGRLKTELDELARPHAETKTSRAVATADGGAR
jgi:hypothetical protein